MKLKRYMKDQLLLIVMWLVLLYITVFFMAVFAVPGQIIVMEAVIAALFLAVVFLGDFFRRKNYYDILQQNMEALDQKYLILETLKRPSFYEGQIYYDMLWEAYKSMREHEKAHERDVRDFKEYVELWVHEVKLPISSLLLMCHNSRDAVSRRFVRQIKRLDGYMDQILYYTRLEHANEDYRFSRVNLKTIVHNVAMKNQDLLLESGITLQVDDIDFYVMTDGKWMEFIINQIFSNSIKYQKPEAEKIIHVFAEEIAGEIETTDETDISEAAAEKSAQLVLHIRDNGIGIAEADQRRVWKKSFTGENGRRGAKSTGMGLYIVKGLCDKLGNPIRLASQEGEYTDVQITFPTLQNCNHLS